MPLHIQEDHLHDDHFTFSNNEFKSKLVVKYFNANLDFETTVPNNIVTIPLGAIVTKLICKVTTAFNGTSPTLYVGKSGSTSEYGDFDIASVGTKPPIHIHNRAIAETTIQADMSIGGSTAGALELYIEYATP